MPTYTIPNPFEAINFPDAIRVNHEIDLEKLNPENIDRFSAFVELNSKQAGKAVGVKSLLDRLGNPLADEPSSIDYLIRWKGELAGHVNVNSWGFNPSMNYWLAEQYQKQGIMPRAVSHVCKLIFDNESVKVIDFHIDVDNAPSQKLAKRLGATCLPSDPSIRNKHWVIPREKYALA